MVAPERKFLPTFRKVFRKIEQLAIRHQGQFHLKTLELDTLVQAFTEAQIEVHIKAMLRARRQALPRSQRGISLAISPRLLRQITEDDLLSLEARYGNETRRIFQNLTTDLNSGVRQALQDAVESNVTPRAAIKSFFESRGYTGKGYWYENLLRTQTQLVYNAARHEEYQRPEIDEILWGYEYVTVGDSRVRDEHAAMDRTVLPKDDPFWRVAFPPNGWNCRCQAVPIFERTRVRRPSSGWEVAPGFNFDPSQITING